MDEQKNANGPGRSGRNDRGNSGRGPGGPGGFGGRNDRGPGGGRGPGGPGGPGGGRGGGRDGGGRGGRDGKGRGRDGKGGRGRDEGGGGYRVVNELSSVEKALTTKDYGAQKEPLESVLKAVRSMHVSSIDKLDPNTRGKLITTIFRVVRQPKPAGADAPAAEDKPASAVEAAPAAEAPAAEVAAAPAAEATEPTPAPAEAAPAAEATEPTPAPSEHPLPTGEGEASAAAAAPAGPDPKIAQWRDVMFIVGQIWRAVGDERNAAMAFAASGRKEEEKQAIQTFHKTGDWKEEAKLLEGGKRTRDAARIHEKNNNFAEALRLHEQGGDLKSALRNAVAGNDEEAITRLVGQMKAPDVRGVLEKAGAYERLMDLYVKSQDFEAVAGLYERARQFDQAALAWERAGKLSNARKSYERVKDTASANRVRELEVKKLIERGDRLGAATLQAGGGHKEAAIATLKGLPAMKAFRFMLKLKMDTEALEFARAEVTKLSAIGQHVSAARWYEMLAEPGSAAESWLKAERKDKAFPLYEQLGDWARAAELAEQSGHLDKAEQLYGRAGNQEAQARVKAMPRVPPPKPPEPAKAEGDDDDAEGT